MWMPDHAERMKQHAGKSWRPSNGTEGDIFIGNVCASCKIGVAKCPIIPEVMAHDLDDEGYPDQWVIGQCGYPQCTDYEPKGAAHEAP